MKLGLYADPTHLLFLGQKVWGSPGLREGVVLTERPGLGSCSP
jgi:hypothetical protein